LVRGRRDIGLQPLRRLVVGAPHLPLPLPRVGEDAGDLVVLGLPQGVPLHGHLRDQHGVVVGVLVLPTPRPLLELKGLEGGAQVVRDLGGVEAVEGAVAVLELDDGAVRGVPLAARHHRCHPHVVPVAVGEPDGEVGEDLVHQEGLRELLTDLLLALEVAPLGQSDEVVGEGADGAGPEPRRLEDVVLHQRRQQVHDQPVPLGFLAVEVDLLQGLGGLECPGVLEGQPDPSPAGGAPHGAPPHPKKNFPLGFTITPALSSK